ncbi:MAG: flagellar FlbD family protein [Frankiales bacterium]|nr:flagellar FlbD family protein [Frankiales bacterium]
MIGLTRTTGEPCRLHPADIQRVETHPCTLVYLSDGAKYAVVEDIDEISRRVRDCRAQAMTKVYRIVDAPAAPTAPSGPADRRPVVPQRSRQDR